MTEEIVTGQPGLRDRETANESLPEPMPVDSARSDRAKCKIVNMNPGALHRRAQELSKDFDRGSIVDKEKVKAIKAAVAAGTYRVDADSIAAKLLALEGELDKVRK